MGCGSVYPIIRIRLWYRLKFRCGSVCPIFRIRLWYPIFRLRLWYRFRFRVLLRWRRGSWGWRRGSV